LRDVVRYGVRNASLWVINNSPNVQAVYVNLSISLSEGLDLIRVGHGGFYSYIESAHPRTYNLVIPLLSPGEAIPFNITLAASVGARDLSATATGYSPSGVATAASAASRVQVVFDRVAVNLVASTSRVEVGSEALITKSAYYEYDRQPFSGTIYLNDTLTKNSVGACRYTVSGISDNLYGLTDFTANTVAITFDRIAVDPAVVTTAPGGISVTTKLYFESDGQPVDKATVTVNGALAAETGPGAFQAEVATWGPTYRLDIAIERPGFSHQDIVLSGYAAGNVAVEVAAAAIFAVALILLIRRRGA
jgi:hypothetical protein